jgi:hypothetical protein
MGTFLFDNYYLVHVTGQYVDQKRNVPCAKKRTVYSGWDSRLERSSQPPVSSLGSEAVTLRLSVGRRGSRPKAKAEDVEPRNPQWEWSMQWDEQKTTLDCAL